MALTVRFVLATAALALVFCVNANVAQGQQKELTADQTQVADTVSAIFGAAAKDDIVKFHSVIAPGFYIFDGGYRFDGDAIMTLIKTEHAKGKRYEWNVTEPDVHINGKTAWIAYLNKGSVTDASGTVNQQWLESAFLERRSGVWKIAFMHSTRVPAAPSPSAAPNR